MTHIAHGLMNLLISVRLKLGADATRRNKNRSSLMLRFEKSTPLEAVKLLVRSGLDVNAQGVIPTQDARGSIVFGPLHHCVMENRPDCLQFLIDHSADPNVGSPPPISWAVNTQSSEMVNILLKARANPWAVTARENNTTVTYSTAIQDALLDKDETILKALVQACGGAVPSWSHLETKRTSLREIDDVIDTVFCAWCFAPKGARQFIACVECQSVSYCSKEHLLEHRASHNVICVKRKIPSFDPPWVALPDDNALDCACTLPTPTLTLDGAATEFQCSLEPYLRHDAVCDLERCGLVAPNRSLRTLALQVVQDLNVLCERLGLRLALGGSMAKGTSVRSRRELDIIAITNYRDVRVFVSSFFKLQKQLRDLIMTELQVNDVTINPLAVTFHWRNFDVDIVLSMKVSAAYMALVMEPRVCFFLGPSISYLQVAFFKGLPPVFQATVRFLKIWRDTWTNWPRGSKPSSYLLELLCKAAYQL